MNSGSKRKKLLLLPVLFIVAHIAAHAAAALQYPGGSRFQPHASGYSLQNNYWCDTLQRSGDNGIPNPGRVAGIISVFALLLSILTLWGCVAAYAMASYRSAWTLRILGLLMLALPGMLPWLHDAAILGGMGAASASLIFMGIMFMRSRHLPEVLGVAVMAFVLVSNFIIWVKDLIPYQYAVYQKLSLLAYCAWGVWMSLRMRK